MELRRAADALLRSQSSPLATLLTPSPTLRWQAGKQPAPRSSPHDSHRRAFATTALRPAFKPTVTTTAAPAPSKDQNNPAEEAKPARTNIQEAAKNLGWLQGGGGGSSRSGNKQIQEQKGNTPRLPHDRELVMNGGSSADDLLQSMNKAFSRPDGRSSGGIDLSRMQTPPSQNGPGLESEMMSIINSTMLPKTERIPIRLSPSLGKTVKVQGNIDVARGFQLMEKGCIRNGVRRDAGYQRYYERRGLKKKRLLRVRWRKKFMAGFKATVGRVKKLRRQGW
jgi:small subunit ribosomal protein MRP21